MYRLEIGKMKYKYLVGAETIAIITPSRRTRIFKLKEAQSNPKFRTQNGTSDSRVAPEEVATLILRHRLR